MVPRLWTVGHSTQSLDQFLGLLAAHDIEMVADVRRYPGSRRWPHFAREALAGALADRGLGYDWFPELGGRRAPRADSANTAWRNAGFRGYADYMATEPFAEGLARLASLGCGLRTAIMCAEAVWWRCHRRIIADYLIAAGETVFHILGQGRVVPARMTAAAQLAPDGALTYPAGDRADAAWAERL
jgi:uncharacterized protein (DUF488 family)